MDPGTFVDEFAVGKVIADVGEVAWNEGDVGGTALEVIAFWAAIYLAIQLG